MLTGVVFTRRIAGTAAEPDWARRAVDVVWSAMGSGSPNPG
jgi:hypothetical protein